MKSHSGTLNKLRLSINEIKDKNEVLYEQADGKLDELEKSIEKLHSLSKKLNTMRDEGTGLPNSFLFQTLPVFELFMSLKEVYDGFKKSR